MKNTVSSLTSDREQRQKNFWALVDRYVADQVGTMAEKMLEAQLDAHLQAGWNQRTDARTGYRNGCYSRKLVSPYGLLDIRVPRCREAGFDPSPVFERYQRRLDDVEAVLRNSFLRGTSARDTAELAEQIYGAAVSHQTICKLMRWLDDDLEKWRKQPIEDVYPVVFVDGMHVDMVGSNRVVMLVAGQKDDGQLDVLGFSIAGGEQCEKLLKDLNKRGLKNVELFVSDDAPAIAAAVEKVFPLASHQDCTFHRLQRLRRTIGATDYRDEMVEEASNVFHCESASAALSVAQFWRRKWQMICPVGVEKFIEGLGRSLVFYDMPKKWWKRIHTNNPMENLIGTLRKRLDLMGCFQNEPAIERAVLGQLLRRHKIVLTQNL